MSGIDDCKITSTTGYKVGDLPGTTLSGTVQESKDVFDSLGLMTISKFNALIDYLKANVTSQMVDLDTIYPVGSIYMSVNSTNPTSLFGGTWSQIQGRFLLACNSTYENGTTGGNAKQYIPEHRHRILQQTTGSSGSHTHTFTDYIGSFERTDIKYGTTSGTKYVVTDVSPVAVSNSSTTGSSGSHTHTISAHYTEYTGNEDVSQMNMPPYLAVYVWKRTA